MATYFTRWYIEFKDNHVTAPATWRVDILDSEGNAPTEPYQLIPAAEPLVTERIDISEDKFTYIIGKQITVSYEFTGAFEEPNPELFFEANERRFRAEVRKNGVLDGVYYIKPDYCQYPDLYPPITISLKAVDGFSYLKGAKFNAFDEDGLLFYQKTPLYDAIMTRSLNQIFDAGTVINVINTLVPNSAEPGFHLLFDVSVHTDIFYDFVEGPLSVYDMLLAFCKTFKARLITDQNQIWFMRIQDLNYSPYTADQYTDATTVNTVALPGFLRSVGPTTSADAIPINLSGRIRMLPAVKEANFEVTYKGINQLYNFDWSEWDGVNFNYWTNSFGMVLNRGGTGTPDDPYTAFIPSFITETADEPFIFQNSQLTSGNTFQIGDIVDFEVKFRFVNVSTFQISIVLLSLTGGTEPQVLTQGGTWVNFFPNGPVDYNHRIVSTRSGKKDIGSIKIKSLPVPAAVGPNALLQVYIYCPNRVSEFPDGPGTPGIYIYPIKIAVISLESKGRHLRITNTADFSQVRELEGFTFIDTGEDGVSNTLFIGPSLEPEDGGWESPKAGVNPGDIERFMAISVIDQYQRSVYSWEGTLESNTLNFFNMLALTYRPDKICLQASDTYNNRTCEHDILMIETFEERPTGEPPNETFTYAEWDIEEEKD
jgi:hypothetical protein